MIIEAICGAAAGMYVYHHVKGAVKAVRELRETKKETARKLIELEEKKKDIERFKDLFVTYGQRMGEQLLKIR